MRGKRERECEECEKVERKSERDREKGRGRIRDRAGKW